MASFAVVFVQDESELVSDNSKCLCDDWDRNVRHAFKAKEYGQPFQFRWLKNNLSVEVVCAKL